MKSHDHLVLLSITAVLYLLAGDPAHVPGVLCSSLSELQASPSVPSAEYPVVVDPQQVPEIEPIRVKVTMIRTARAGLETLGFEWLGSGPQPMGNSGK
jgi:hypothetical protein